MRLGTQCLFYCACLCLAEQKVHTRSCQDIRLAYLYATTPHMFSPEDHTEQAFNNVRDAVRTPLYGCDCYAYGLLAAGCVDLVVEADLKPYDYMALVTVVQEAGGVMTDWLVSRLVILLMAQLLNESLSHTTLLL